MRAELSFTECEHEGDLENYLGDLRESGAKIADSDINYEAEVGHVTIEVEDKDSFIEKFKETDSYGFSSLG